MGHCVRFQRSSFFFFTFQECTKGPRVIRARTPDDPYESFGSHSRPHRIWSLNRPNVYSMELKVTIALSRQLSFCHFRITLGRFFRLQVEIRIKNEDALKSRGTGTLRMRASPYFARYSALQRFVLSDHSNAFKWYSGESLPTSLFKFFFH